MKPNHFNERMISSLSLGALGFFFILSANSFIKENLITELVILGVITSVGCSIYGFYYGYKSILLPASYLTNLPFRLIATPWLVSLLYFITMTIYFHFSNAMTIPVVYSIAIGLIGLILGWKIVYKLLMLPQVDYISSYPSFAQRIVATLWFGTAGYLLACLIMHGEGVLICFFVLLMSSYLGFIYGYRILLLPTTLRGGLKSIMMGIVGSSYALLIVFLEQLFVMMITSDNSFSTLNTASLISSIADGFELIFTFYFIIFPMMSFFISVVGGVFSLILFILSRPWASISK